MCEKVDVFLINDFEKQNLFKNKKLAKYLQDNFLPQKSECDIKERSGNRAT